MQGALGGQNGKAHRPALDYRPVYHHHSWRGRPRQGKRERLALLAWYSAAVSCWKNTIFLYMEDAVALWKLDY